MRIVTSSEMRRLEAASGRPTSDLMEQAGAGVFSKIQALASRKTPIVVLCGKGNNGGDGLVVARLAAEAGFSVRCWATVAPGGLNDVCREKWSLLEQRKIDVLCHGGLELAKLEPSSDALYVDALLGTGLAGPPKGAVLEAIQFLDGRKVVSIDVPSGVDADSGLVPSDAVTAHSTVVLGLPKPYLFVGGGHKLAGSWNVHDMGFDAETIGEEFVIPEEVRLSPRDSEAHKGTCGHVLVVAGSLKYRGAAALTALGAVHAGAGLVTVASVEPVVSVVATHVPEAVFLSLEGSDGGISSKMAPQLVDIQAKFTSCIIGPGLGDSPEVRQFLESLLVTWEVPTVLDADGLNHLAEGAKRPSGLTVVTPHPGEAAKMLGVETAVVQNDRWAAARRLAKMHGCECVLKGRHTVVANPDGHVWVNSTGNSGMATAGSGDVLAGTTAALLAGHQANPEWPTGLISAMLHGLAGDLAAEKFGKIGYSASQLAHFLPRARSILTK